MEAESGQTRVDLIRHGEHELGNVLCGKMDPGLTEKGFSQLDQRCQSLSESGSAWDLCVTSPRRRCEDFARRLSSSNQVQLIVEPGFAEVDFGDWEGMPPNDIYANYPGHWQQWIDNPTSSAPHRGEKYRDFTDRVINAWENLLATFRHQRILLVSHGGVMRVIYAHALELNHHAISRFNVPHACHTRIVVFQTDTGNHWYQLDSHNSRL